MIVGLPFFLYGWEWAILEQEPTPIFDNLVKEYKW